ncbi:cysteine protease [Frankia sp. CNm7]|uniref:Cysteine protease n=1 Tax=Frankia nepalensis TaxID=1836974 RepID=A0A937RHP2_9ACTN|nr:cysteine protease [Frankia nepalensis]MBL7494858.1 cysteine protease [Frankia nepalensis]MBL7512212.1 cysteine protease [Frankia nepalensis]MBL7518211.1 cysteine protease [Frankia nepalensis]MBL7626573.1 cysteine protease [Frankia nepalensis]
MSFLHGDTPVVGFGPLTLDDLARRSEKAYADHMATYAATEVLHQVVVSAPEYDRQVAELVDAAYLLVREFRKKTKAEWRTAYRVWATAAGITVPPDADDDSDDDGED